jgi:hypothetical protein
MRHITCSALLTTWLMAVPLAGDAAAVSVDDLLNLKANGLSDDILVALIETDGSVFRLTPEDVVTLHRRGLGERVILAMIRSNRGTPETPAPTVFAPAPIQQTIVQHVAVNEAPQPVVVEVPVAVPVPIAVPVVAPRPAAPVYWGFGGTLRPDSWRPALEKDTRSPSPDTPARRR